MLKFKEDLLKPLAQSLEGPFLHPPVGSPYTLQELRNVKWEKLRESEKLFRLNEARSMLRQLIEEEAFTTEYLKKILDWS